MKKNYIEPNIDVITLKMENVLTTTSSVQSGESWGGEGDNENHEGD